LTVNRLGGLRPSPSTRVERGHSLITDPVNTGKGRGGVRRGSQGSLRRKAPPPGSEDSWWENLGEDERGRESILID